MRPIPKIEDYKNSDRNEGGTFTYDLMIWAKEAETELSVSDLIIKAANRLVKKLKATNSERQLKIEQLEDKLNQTSK